MSPDPFEYGWWIAARAAGITAIILVSISVGLGLAMATRTTRRPGMSVALRRTHQYVALAALCAIGAHGLFLLLDPWLKAGVSGILVPFSMGYRPLWTGLGVIAGWSVVVLGLTYWLRSRIGPNRWKTIHRFTLAAYVVALVHVIGSGTDATSTWLLVILSVALLPVIPLLALRLRSRSAGPDAPVPPPSARPPSARRRSSRPAAPQATRTRAAPSAPPAPSERPSRLFT